MRTKDLVFAVETLATAIVIAWAIALPENFLLWAAATVLATWVAYVIIMTANNRKDELHWTIKASVYVLLPFGITLDFILNVVFATVLLLDKPRWGEWLLTARLKRVKEEEGAGIGPAILSAYRYTAAYLICRYLLNPFDKDHC